ncbi:MAG: hypothetical protein GF329_14200 [Candidatus Lokiarchaeota archaeon]|nr:hypothetical protein [Candidatus Lokiarchaeota archaeon]
MLGLQMLGELKERINILEESFHKADFRVSMNKVSKVVLLLDNMRKLILRLRIYEEIYDVSS